MFGAGGKRLVRPRATRTGAVRHARSQSGRVASRASSLCQSRFDQLETYEGVTTVRGTGIKIEARDGVVTLRGVVEQASVVGRAEAIARTVGGVKAVDNKLIASSLFEHD
jgi:hypothetical protein